MADIVHRVNSIPADALAAAADRASSGIILSQVPVLQGLMFQCE